MEMTEQERNEFREFNGRVIEELCELGDKIVAPYVSKLAHEQAGMSREQYRQAESLYLHGDLSGIER